MIAYDTIHGCVCNIHATWKMLHYVQLQLKPPPSEISKKVVSIKSMGGGFNVDITGIPVRSLLYPPPEFGKFFGIVVCVGGIRPKLPQNFWVWNFCQIDLSKKKFRLRRYT